MTHPRFAHQNLFQRTHHPQLFKQPQPATNFNELIAVNPLRVVERCQLIPPTYNTDMESWTDTFKMFRSF